MAKHMNYGRFAWLLGVFGVLSGCSGRFDVGVIPGGAGTGGGAGGENIPGETGPDTGPNPMGAGAPSTGPITGGAAGSAEAGAPASRPYYPNAGGDPTNYCNVPLPGARSTVFAAPAAVLQRIQLFLLNQSIPMSSAVLPQVTTREWAGDTALALLDSLNVESAPGITRFIDEWWPGAPNPTVWGSYFSSRRGTLRTLLTVDVRGDGHGSGVLTDSGLLEIRRISARGAFISDHLLCQPIAPPPPSVLQVLPPQPGLSLRQQLTIATANPACVACHRMMDPLGFSLEHFVENGAFQNLEYGLPVDSSSSLNLPTSGNVSFSDVNDFAQQVSNTCEVVTCFTKQLLADAQNNALLPGILDEREIADIALQFSDSGLDLRSLVRFVVQSDAFLRAP